MEPAVLDHPKHAPQYNRGTPRRFIPKKELLPMLGVGNTTFYDWIKQGLFPAPIKLTPNGRRVTWDSWAVEDWLQERIAASQSEEAGK